MVYIKKSKRLEQFIKKPKKGDLIRVYMPNSKVCYGIAKKIIVAEVGSDRSYKYIREVVVLDYYHTESDQEPDFCLSFNKVKFGA